MMTLCPIAYWKQQRPEALALSSLSYRDFDTLIQCVCSNLKKIESPILAFVPKNTPLDLAFFFASWRMGKAVYPLSFRLPVQAIRERVLRTGASWIDLNTFSLSNSIERTEIPVNTLATLIETSTASKIVCHEYKSHVCSARAAIEMLELTHQDRYCLNLPLFHISGIALFLRCFIAGATLLFPEQLEEATHISMVPTQLYRMIEAKQTLPKAKYLLIGGAPISSTLYEKALDQKLPIYLSYGMTESASMVVIQPPDRSTRVLSHVQLRLAQDGEIHLRGPSIFQKYWGDRDRQENEWFPTRDIGKKDALGVLKIIGRKDRQFISGGENIHPEEIETDAS